MSISMLDSSVESLREQATTQLDKSVLGIIRWVAAVRDTHPGRFAWAIETTRDANVAATAYALGGFRKMGVFDRIITDEDRRGGIEWIRSLATGSGEYRDPALVARKSPDWPTDAEWPDSGMRECNSRYAQTVLREYGDPDDEQSPPPPGWPQLDDGPERAVEWIKARPWNESAWGSGSWAAKMMRYLLEWHLAEKMAIDPLIESLRFIYQIQDPDDGLWGGRDVPIQNRINGTFKLFHFIRNQLDLPLRHAEKLIDVVLDRFYDPNYDKTVGGCDEFDNWYVILHALPQTDQHRIEEIRKMAAYRIMVILETFAKDDGGISFYPDRCQTAWVGIDMAPALAQGDAMGLGLITSSVCTAVGLSGLTGATSWLGVPNEDARYPENVRRSVAEGAGLL